MKSGIQIKNEKKENALVVHLEGKLDAVSSPVLEDALCEDIQAGETKILLDFSHVDYLSSAGLRVLLSNTKKLKTNGGVLQIYGMLDDVLEIVKMAGFERVLNLHSSEEEALN
ncbi:MAG: STAS domain-containing protein [Rhabdochlamydiaceae bacterium]|nr:STAS domain-containing protein [Candidatus Amphrikana amoebophyrae]